ncbi:hypothetical protein MHYP_G00043980 [Metynnis hypsauchen]
MGLACCNCYQHSVRFCCDYRRLNQVTCKDAYPLPRVEDSLDALGGAQLFSTLDLMAVYFQVAMSEKDRELRQHGLKLKPSKCFLLKLEVKFLGHLISPKGIQVDEEKVLALETWPVPNNVREVRQVLGFMSYYRRFVPGFAHIA